MNPRLLGLMLLALAHAPVHADHRGEIHPFAVEQVTTGKTPRASMAPISSSAIRWAGPPSDLGSCG